jgi:hypothetical protein
MRQTRQGVRSTKVADEDALAFFNPTPGVKHKDAYLRVFDATKKPMYSDQTGRFPVTSSKGNKYLMVACELDGNYIDAEPLRDRTKGELVKGYNAIFTRWKQTGTISPNWHILDNEAPEELKSAIRENGCRVELTPADNHRRNAAERAIQTFKGNFISVLAGVADDFPITRWDELIPGTVLQTNLLRQSNVAPKVSAYAYLHGPFDYNRMPLAPLGCACQFHVKPGRRSTWGEHASDGWYVGTSPEHYRTHLIFVKATKHLRLSDTVYFKHKYVTQPTVTTEDRIINAYRLLTQAIKGFAASKGDASMDALQRLQEALSPGNTRPIQIEQAPQQERVPRVQFTETPLQLTSSDAEPRVPSNLIPMEPPRRLIVAWPAEPIVESPAPQQVVASRQQFQQKQIPTTRT